MTTTKRTTHQLSMLSYEIDAIVTNDKTQHRVIVNEVEQGAAKFAIGDLLRVNDSFLLKIIGLRREKVQAISQADVLASGLKSREDGQGFYWYENSPKSPKGSVFYLTDYKDAFETYWTLKHGTEAWVQNTEVLVIDFEVSNEVEAVYIHPDINSFVLLDGTNFTLFKNNERRLMLSVESPELDVKHKSVMLEREALRMRDSLLKMYPPSPELLLEMYQQSQK